MTDTDRLKGKKNKTDRHNLIDEIKKTDRREDRKKLIDKHRKTLTGMRTY